MKPDSRCARLPRYDICHDRDGWFILCEGHELPIRRRYPSFAEADERLAVLEAEDRARAR
jgi:hypothetical protein